LGLVQNIFAAGRAKDVKVLTNYRGGDRFENVIRWNYLLCPELESALALNGEAGAS
jgi:hypothetical protein